MIRSIRVALVTLLATLALLAGGAVASAQHLPEPKPPVGLVSISPLPIRVHGSGDHVLSFNAARPWHLSFGFNCASAQPQPGHLVISDSSPRSWPRVLVDVTSTSFGSGSVVEQATGLQVLTVTSTCNWSVRVHY